MNGADNDLVSGKKSVKDKISRKFKFTFVKTEQKLRHSPKTKFECDSNAVEMYHTQLKQKKVCIRNLSEQWKKYLSKAEDLSKSASLFEDELLFSLKMNGESCCKIENVPTAFPTNINPPIGETLQILKDLLESAAKKLKVAESHYDDFLANANIYEKAAEAKKEQEKNAMEVARAKFKKDVEELDISIPSIMKEIDEKLHRCALDYSTNKTQYLNMALQETRSFQEQINATQAQSRSSGAPSSAAQSGMTSQSSESSKVSNVQSPNVYSRSDGAHSSPSSKETSSRLSTSSDTSSPRTALAPTTLMTVEFKMENESSSAHPKSTDCDITPVNEKPSNGDESIDLTSLTPPFEVTAVYAYTSEESDELQFGAGETVTVMPWKNPDDVEPGWLYGRHKKTGLAGLFPANYVKLQTEKS